MKPWWMVALLTASSPFTDITGESGIAFRHENSPTPEKYLIETMGGGVAVFDFDNDGLLDLFFTNGAKIAPPAKPDKREAKYWNRLYRNLGRNRFEDVTEKTGLAGGYSNYSMGVAAGDFDNDGFVDLYVTAYGMATLYRNLGNNAFEDVTAKSGAGVTGWSTSAGFFDYDNDGDLDLFVGRYLGWDFGKNLYCGERLPGRRAYCHPDNFKGVTNVLLRNNGDGTFADVSKESGIANPKGKTLGVAFADYDNDGLTDVYVANDSVQCFLYKNLGKGKFRDESLVAGVGFNEDGRTFAGMGADFADYDNDGNADIIVTNLSNEIYRLFRNEGDGMFTDIVAKSGLGQATLLYSGWGVKFFDFDNDGWKDLFVAQGHVLDTIEMTAPHLKYLQPPLLLRNEKGRFTAAGPFPKAWAGRAAAFGDLDNDGDVDVVVANVGQPAVVFRNDAGAKSAWLTLKLVGTKSNRDGIGAVVKVTGESGLVQHFMVNTAASYQSANDPRVHIGMGTDSTAKSIEIRWPTGLVQKFENVKVRQQLTVKEGS
ncbi:MAG: CRTAC1 family protein [Bryobacteraceae bacterium]|nr:CRTAC1 family protein [Bryobacteraceae bacterium]